MNTVHDKRVGPVVGTSERGVVVVFNFGRKLFVAGVDGRVVDVVLVAARARSLAHPVGDQHLGEAAHRALDLVGAARGRLPREQVAGVHGDAEGGLSPAALKDGLALEAGRGGENLAEDETVPGNGAGLA